MQAGQLTSRELTTAYLNRIEELNQRGPCLRAVIEINPDALAIADQLDQERSAGRVRSPIHGIPILIKDNIASADRMETSAGSLALIGAKPLKDAAVVARLRAAGAVLLGKTNMSEWAGYRSSLLVSGWSARGGQTLSPYALDRDPNGSSSGSAVAVAADMCVAAIGTETHGSIVEPACTCSIVGLKPTVGLVSRAGIIPISMSQDTAGPMARTVEDAAILLSVIAGPDPEDSATISGRPKIQSVDYAADRLQRGLRGARIGVLHGPFGFRPRMEHILTEAVSAIEAAGATVFNLGDFPHYSEMLMPEREVLLYELKNGLNAYLSKLGPNTPMKTLADLVRFNNEHASQEMPFFGQDRFISAQAKGPLTDEAYVQARATCVRLARTEGIDAIMNANRLDAIIALTDGPAKLFDPIVGGDLSSAEGSYRPAAIAGYPDITVPAGEIGSLPVGISFFGRAWSESILLGLAADFERRTHARRAPRYLATSGKYEP
jgi:amidase